MPANYVLLERIELNASASSVTFSNIPQSGYTDLKVVLSTRTDYATNGDSAYIRFNGATTGFSAKRLQGDGSIAYSANATEILFATDAANDTANTFSNVEIYIPNYTSNNQKSVSFDSVSENNATQAYQRLGAALWTGTGAITSATITPNNGNFVANSTFSLYGLAAVGTTPVIAPKASGGNITTDGTYWYHTFISTDVFTPQTALTCDVLQVAGGGGGGGAIGAGGGAGGLLTFTSQSLLTATTVTVGAGGAGGTASANGASGNNSQLGSLTASVGGGRGGTRGQTITGVTGGSGGGGTGGGAGAAGTSGQGYAGGTSPSDAAPAYAGAGGGGAGAVGTNTTSTTGGNGGIGFYNSLTNAMGAATYTGQLSSSNYYYAGGGAGGTDNPTGGGGTPGTAGLGGGGAAAASRSVSASPGTAGTGGGGGGNSNGSGTVGGNGGSGIVIIRYTIA